MIRIGVISDTHRRRAEPGFSKTVTDLFGGLDMLLHAGDLTSIDLLEAFGKLKVLAVHGNMCDMKTASTLPAERYIEAGGFKIALTHGSGSAQGIEDRLLARYGEVDCIVYGHTHIPSINRYGDILMVNPGSFASSGYGGATYALIEIDRDISAKIMEAEIR